MWLTLVGILVFLALRGWWFMLLLGLAVVVIVTVTLPEETDRRPPHLPDGAASPPQRQRPRSVGGPPIPTGWTPDASPGFTSHMVRSRALDEHAARGEVPCRCNGEFEHCPDCCGSGWRAM